MRLGGLTAHTRRLGALLLMVIGLSFGASAALAHADLESTTPVNGEVVDGPLEVVELVFTAPVEVVTAETRALDGNGSAIGLTIAQSEPELVQLVFDDPIDSGRVAVLWVAQSDDGHRIEGTLAVEVASSEPPASEESTTTRPPTSTTTTSGLVATSTTTPQTTTTVASAIVPAASSGSDTADTGPALLTGVGRWFIVAGSLLAIGAAAFATGALIGTVDEVARSLRWMNLGGVAVLAGTALEIAGTGLSQDSTIVGAFAPSQIADGFTELHLVAIALRVIGAIAIIQIPTLASVKALRDGIGPAQTTPNGDKAGVDARVADPPGVRLDLANEWLAIAGLTAIAVSFGFDGHSSSAGVLGRAAAVGHVIAAGVWAGGLWVMADAVARRMRTAVEADIGHLAIRFSRVATVAVIVVGIAGFALTASIVDSVSDVFTTPWGRLLLTKVALVAVVAAVGAYNHFKVVPSIGATPDSKAVLSTTIRIEAAIVLVVSMITAALMAASI